MRNFGVLSRFFLNLIIFKQTFILTFIEISNQYKDKLIL